MQNATPLQELIAQKPYRSRVKAENLNQACFCKNVLFGQKIIEKLILRGVQLINYFLTLPSFWFYIPLKSILSQSSKFLQEDIWFGLLALTYWNQYVQIAWKPLTAPCLFVFFLTQKIIYVHFVRHFCSWDQIIKRKSVELFRETNRMFTSCSRF